MIHIIGGAGYVGRHLRAALANIHAEYTVIDPAAQTGTAADVHPRDGDWVVWLAGPRNNGSNVTQRAYAHMLEQQWFDFLDRTSGRDINVLFLSSMSIFDHTASEYKEHKCRMDGLYRSYGDGLRRALALWPGTVIGTMPGVMAVRADTCANAVALSLGDGTARVNLATTRCFVRMSTLVERIMHCLNHGHVDGSPYVYETIASLAQVIPPEMLEHNQPKYFWEPTPTPQSPFFLSPPKLQPDALPELQDAVRYVYENAKDIERL